MSQARYRRRQPSPLKTGGDRIVAERGVTIFKRPEMAFVHEWFDDQVRRTPEAVALVHDGQHVTYKALQWNADRWAHKLRSLGVTEEIRVGIYMNRGIHMVLAVLATLKAGGTYVPLDVKLPPERLRMILLDSRPLLVLAEPNLKRPVSAGELWVAIDYEEAAAYCSFERPVFSGVQHAAAYILYTSGSTGLPKGVVVEHAQLTNYIRAVTERADLRSCTAFAMLQPLTVDSSLTVLFSSLCNGACLHLISEQLAGDPAGLAAYFEGERIDCLKIAPSHLAALHSCGNPRLLMPRRCLVLGGEPSRSDWVRAISRTAPRCAVFNHYGPTETTVGVTTYRFDPLLAPNENYMVPLGRSLANCRIYILDSCCGTPVSEGAIGELYVGGEPVARGYLNAPRLTASHFLPDPFAGVSGARMYRTGDLGRYIEGGDIAFCGRSDAQVKIRGHRVEPGEIEATLEQHPLVERACVVSSANRFGEIQLAAYLISKQHLTSDDLREFLSRKLPEYMIPAEFIRLEQLPLTAHGKVDRRALNGVRKPLS